MINLTVQALADRAQELCVDGDQISLPPQMPDHYHCPCFLGCYILSLLTFYGLAREQTVQFRGGVNWDQGFMLETASRGEVGWAKLLQVADQPHRHLDASPVWFLSGFLLTMAAIFMLYTGRKRV